MSVVATSQPLPALQASTSFIRPFSHASSAGGASIASVRTSLANNHVTLARTDFPLLHSLLESPEYRRAVTENPELVRRPSAALSRTSSSKPARSSRVPSSKSSKGRPRKASQASDRRARASQTRGRDASSAAGSFVAPQRFNTLHEQHVQHRSAGHVQSSLSKAPRERLPPVRCQSAQAPGRQLFESAGRPVPPIPLGVPPFSACPPPQSAVDLNKRIQGPASEPTRPTDELGAPPVSLAAERAFLPLLVLEPCL